MPKGIKSNFEYHVPKSLAEAFAMLSKYGDGADARLIAGGTDLLPKLKSGIVEFGHLVSLKDLPDLHGISVDGEGRLHIGACATLRETEAFPGVKEHWPALYQAMQSMASTQIRNRGTVAGNICNAVPSADTAPALIVYGAEVVLKNADRERVVPITDFFTGVCKTCIAPNEVLTEIIVPLPRAGACSVYYKYTLRKALDLAMIGVASNVLVEKGVVKDAKISLGAVAVVPKRAPNAEQFIIGKPLTEEMALEAAWIASRNDCKPISDIRATAEYRREMVRLNVRDALRLAAGL